MSLVAQQILVVIVFAALMFALNLKAGSRWLALLTLLTGVSASVLAGYLIVDWIFLS